jgi:hypothetical protein
MSVNMLALSAFQSTRQIIEKFARLFINLSNGFCLELDVFDFHKLELEMCHGFVGELLGKPLLHCKCKYVVYANTFRFVCRWRQLRKFSNFDFPPTAEESEPRGFIW